jgi:hypothetical protein
MGGQAVRSGGIAHLSTHGAVFVVKASSLALVWIVPSRDRGSHWEFQASRRIVTWNRAREKTLRAERSRGGAALTLVLEIDNYAEIAGFGLSVRNVEALRRQAPPQQFANRRCAARHVTAEPPLIEGGKLF